MQAASPLAAFPARPVDTTFRPFNDPSDLDVLSAVAGGDRDMFAIIVRRYNQPLYRTGMAYLRNHAQTEEAMQNTYVKAFQKLATFRHTSAFSTWLTRIMINECLMLIRRQRSSPVTPISNLFGEAEAAPEPIASEQAHRADMKKLLEQAVAVLPRNYRAVYVLREVEQLSVAETAACLGISAANVKVLLHRARERLKAELLKTASAAELFAYTAEYCDPMTARVMDAVRGNPTIVKV